MAVVMVTGSSEDCNNGMRAVAMTTRGPAEDGR